jgi:hypothetical protein
MRLFVLSAPVVTAFVVTMAVHPIPASAVIYCKAAGVPRGCVVRGAAPTAESKLCPIVQLAPDGSMISVIACDLPDTPLYGRPPARRQRTAAVKRK